MAATIKTGVLLVNLGTPEAPTPKAIRRYLRQFLSDPRVVELPRAIWLPLLYGFILPFRPGRLAEAYEKIWTADGSPLLAISRRQEAALQSALGADVPVVLAMSYGEPGIPAGLKELERRGARRVIVLPLYPQYSGTTTASVFDAVFAALKQRRWIPELRTINTYHDDPGYISALAESVREHWAKNGCAEHLLISFHSIPANYVAQGDPYQRECLTTAQLLAQALELKDGSWSVSYQSRLGRQPWLQPYTDVVLPELAAKGIGTVDTICPGFPADCLETLEEVAIRYGELFTASGGRALRYIPALNTRPAHISALSRLLTRQLG